MEERGKIYLVATPIGNLSDMSPRAVATLREADLIAAEDTRNTIKLLNHFEIRTHMTSYHEYNRTEKAYELVRRAEQGETIAVVTDAGMPAISDPGEVLVRFALDAGIEVTIVPGPCAAVSALAVSGQPTGRFVFEAFLPQDKKERRVRLEALRDETRTMILYEAPHRLARTLAELAEVLGRQRQLSLVRELTKKHEEVQRGSFSHFLQRYADEAGRAEIRGEYVLVIAGKSEAELRAEEAEAFADLTPAEHVAWYESQGFDRKEAMKKAAKDRGISRRGLYHMLL